VNAPPKLYPGFRIRGLRSVRPDRRSGPRVRPGTWFRARSGPRARQHPRSHRNFHVYAWRLIRLQRTQWPWTRGPIRRVPPPRLFCRRPPRVRPYGRNHTVRYWCRYRHGDAYRDDHWINHREERRYIRGITHSMPPHPIWTGSILTEARPSLVRFVLIENDPPGRSNRDRVPHDEPMPRGHRQNTRYNLATGRRYSCGEVSGRLPSDSTSLRDRAATPCVARSPHGEPPSRAVEDFPPFASRPNDFARFLSRKRPLIEVV